MSHGLRGESPFFCAWHFRCDNAIAGDEIVQDSRRWDRNPETYLAMRRAGSSKPLREEKAA